MMSESVGQDDDRANMRRFVTDRPECLDVLTDRERQIFIASGSECSYQRKTLAALSRAFGVSGTRIRQLEEAAIRKIMRFRDQDEHKCLHCDGRGWSIPEEPGE